RDIPLGEQPKKKTESYPMFVYYPNADTMSAATPIHITGGQRVRVAFSLKRVPAFKFGGVISGLETFKQMNPPAIVDDAGNMVAGVNHWDSRTGSFEFLPLPAGTYTLLLSGQDEGGVYSMRPQRIVLDHDRPDSLLHVKPGLTIPITVRLELNDPSAFPRTC